MRGKKVEKRLKNCEKKIRENFEDLRCDIWILGEESLKKIKEKEIEAKQNKKSPITRILLAAIVLVIVLYFTHRNYSVVNLDLINLLYTLEAIGYGVFLALIVNTRISQIDEVNDIIKDFKATERHLELLSNTLNYHDDIDDEEEDEDENE